MHLSGSRVLVTGASSGIGAATARAMAARGAGVALLARTRAALEAVAAEIRTAGGRAHVFPVDLADHAAVDAVAPRLRADFGTPNVIVNSAGAGRWLFAEETDPAEAVQMMGAPYFAAFFVTRAFLPAMLARGSGHVVNVNSPIARLIWPGATGYAAARYAMQGFTDALRADLFGTGLRVTAVVAGKVETPYFAHNPGTLERAPGAARLIPAVQPEQVAAAIVRAVEYNQREVVMPFMLRVFFTLHTFFPWLTESLAVRTGWRHPRRVP
jgi:short-subunit dehydrogenase